MMTSNFDIFLTIGFTPYKAEKSLIKHVIFVKKGSPRRKTKRKPD